MQVNTALYKPLISSPEKYSDVELIKQTSIKHRVYCNKDNNCEMLLAEVNAGKEYEILYAVTNTTFISSSSTMSDPSIYMLYVTPEYTSFEVFWRISLLTAMCCGTLFFLYSLRTVPIMNWSLEQKWTLFLTLSITVCNNPFYSYEFITANEFFPAINAMFDTALLCALLLYVLVIFDALRKVCFSFKTKHILHEAFESKNYNALLCTKNCTHRIA